jgi:hypothetical protein
VEVGQLRPVTQDGQDKVVDTGDRHLGYVPVLVTRRLQSTESVDGPNSHGRT